jgi:uncharacterized SAM-binding protein YcdF (DUF218 family)
VTEPVRLVAVLGYSHGDGEGIHPICAERLRHAEGIAAGARAVVLSGWSRSPNARGEAELMRDEWSGPDVLLICDTTARSTAENAAAVAAASRELGADEVVVVTSHWHSLRARTLVRAALPPRTELRTSSPRGAAPPGLLARELVCLVGMPVQTLRLRRSSTSATMRPGPGRNASSSGGL